MRDIKDISCVCKSCVFSGVKDVMVAEKTQPSDVCAPIFHRHTTMCLGLQIDLCTPVLVITGAHKHVHTHL